MKSESIAFALAGIAFGLIAGWIIGTEQASVRPPAAAVQAQGETQTSGSSEPSSRAAVLNEAQVRALKSIAEKEPASPKPRAELANL